MSGGRVVAILLIAAGILIGVLGLIWIGVSAAGGGLQAAGAVLGAFFVAILVLPLLGAGVFLLIRSGQEAEEDEERAELRMILDMVETRGEVPIGDIVLELGTSRDEVKNQIHHLVGMGLFTGYIFWDEGILYSADASGLRGLERCKHCGGEVHLVGKGVMSCPYCGTEYFLD